MDVSTVVCDYVCCLLSSLGGIASCSASDSVYWYTFLRSVVCLSVVCHIRRFLLVLHVRIILLNILCCLEEMAAYVLLFTRMTK